MKEYLPFLVLPLAFLGIMEINKKTHGNIITKGLDRKMIKDVFDVAKEDIPEEEFKEWADAYYISREDLFEIIKEIIKKQKIEIATEGIVKTSKKALNEIKNP